MISRPSIFHNIVLRDLFVGHNNMISELNLLSPPPLSIIFGRFFFLFFKWLDDLLLFCYLQPPVSGKSESLRNGAGQKVILRLATSIVDAMLACVLSGTCRLFLLFLPFPGCEGVVKMMIL